MEELDFWEIDEMLLQKCCHQKYLIEREVLEDESLDGQTEEVFPTHKFSDVQRKIWYLFEHPASSQGAKFIAMFSIFCIFVSTLLLTLDTLPFFQVLLSLSNFKRRNIISGAAIEIRSFGSVCFD